MTEFSEADVREGLRQLAAKHQAELAALQARLDESVKQRDLDNNAWRETVREIEKSHMYATQTLRADLEKAAAFKVFVHARLDQMDVPKEFPEGEHSKEGCRVGDRLDWLAERIIPYPTSLAELAETRRGLLVAARSERDVERALRQHAWSVLKRIGARVGWVDREDDAAWQERIVGLVDLLLAKVPA